MTKWQEKLDPAEGRWITTKRGVRIFIRFAGKAPSDKYSKKKKLLPGSSKNTINTINLDQTIKNKRIDDLKTMYSRADIKHGYINVHNKCEVKDVTEEYIKNARPGEGKVIVEEDKTSKHSRDEIDDAYFIRDYFGGNVSVLSVRRNSQGIKMKTPDYLWEDGLIDRKSVEGKKLRTRVEHGCNQIIQNISVNVMDKKVHGKPKGILISLIEKTKGKPALTFSFIEHSITRGMNEVEAITTADFIIKRDDGSLYILRVTKK